MRNSYREIKRVAALRGLDQETLIHALMATIYGNCCNECTAQLHSEEFLRAFDRMIQAMILCGEMSKRKSA
ncbi:MAG: hypothetical protein C5B54_03765 [Acidobacteria bacterium]|nr:MAG: hypothetical protein C5B54_03765 [Acidobacteriota bacterium]